MTKPKITVHTIVKNEQRWVWFAVNSVLDYVDEILVWDTGSSDATVSIIKSIDSPKIKFRQVIAEDANAFTLISQRMLEATSSDWMLIVDGDEIWTRAGISATVDFISAAGDSVEFIIQPYYNLIGDVYHYQDPSAGRYHIGSYSGHVTIRAVNMTKIPGLHYDRPHMQRGLFDAKGTLIQDRPQAQSRYMPIPYFHTTHLHRSLTAAQDSQVVKRRPKYKYELGHPFPPDFVYPEVFYLPRPEEVPSPWLHRDFRYLVAASWQTPLRILKRKYESVLSHR